MFAQGGPPLILTDPGTPGPGNWEINIFASLERSALNREYQIPQFDINYGVGNRTQLTLTTPFALSEEKDSGTRRSFDWLEMGVKYRFIDNPGTTGSNFALFPQVHFSFEDEREVELSLPLEWHQEWEHFGLTAELAHTWVNGKSEGWEGGVAAAWILDPVDILVEWHTAVRETPYDLREPMMNIGFTWEWSEHVVLLASFGKSIQHHDEDTDTWAVLGFQFLF
jgi:hypothetical protein